MWKNLGGGGAYKVYALQGLQEPDDSCLVHCDRWLRGGRGLRWSARIAPDNTWRGGVRCLSQAVSEGRGWLCHICRRVLGPEQAGWLSYRGTVQSFYTDKASEPPPQKTLIPPPSNIFFVVSACAFFFNHPTSNDHRRRKSEFKPAAPS